MLALLWSWWVGSAWAADWSTLLGTEEGRPDEPVKVFGFVQPQLEVVQGEEVNGQTPLFGLAYGTGPWTFSLHRARLGARGSIPKTGQKVSYFLLFGSGEVAITRGEPVVLTDYSLTFSYVPGARLRVGQFKLPVMEEVVPAAPQALEFVHFSTTLVKLLLENNVGADGAYVGGAWGFRDVGVQVFDGFQSGHVAGAYAVMVSNGAGLSAVDTDAAKDVSGRAEVAWVTDGEITSPRREEIKLGAWWLEGRRELADEEVRRVRRGAYLHVEQGVAWGLFEVAQGEGALELGPNPPFPGSPVVVAPDGVGWGLVGQGGVRVGLGDQVKLGIKTRYDQYHQQIEVAESTRIFRTVTAGVELDPAPTVRLQTNLELRKLDAPYGSPEAQALVATMGPRFTVQATAMF